MVDWKYCIGEGLVLHKLSPTDLTRVDEAFYDGWIVAQHETCQPYFDVTDVFDSKGDALNAIRLRLENDLDETINHLMDIRRRLHRLEHDGAGFVGVP